MYIYIKVTILTILIFASMVILSCSGNTSLDFNNKYLFTYIQSNNVRTIAKFNTETGSLFDKEKTTLSAYPCGKKETIYKIPETVKTIGNSAFKGNMNLAEIKLNDKIEKIKDNAFRECRSLLQIIIPDSVTEIGMDVFTAAKI